MLGLSRVWEAASGGERIVKWTSRGSAYVPIWAGGFRSAEASSRVAPVVSSRLLPGGLPLERKITRQESDDAGR